MERIINDSESILGIKVSDCDAICVDASPDCHVINDTLDINEPWKLLNKQANPFWAQFTAPVFQLSHHTAHSYSCWPIVDVEKIKTSFVVDGEGEFVRHTSVIENGKVIDYIDDREHNGLSKILERVGLGYGMKGMRLDISGKTMALKSFHDVKPETISKLVQLTEPLSYRHLNTFLQLSERFFGPIGTLNTNEKQKIINILYLLHVFGEEKLPKLFQAYVQDRDQHVSYSGGTAQNTCINTRIRDVLPNLHIPPHCPDDGISLGCVEFLRQKFEQNQFSRANFPYWQSDEAPPEQPSDKTIDRTAELLAKGKIVAWYQGNGEIGPRALGNRSILMDPSIKDGKDKINAKVKRREAYRPFGASVLLDHTPKHFKCDYETPYMLYVIECLTNDYPAIMHVDSTCRIQTVSQQDQYLTYYKLIDKFREKTGIPLVLNTSLNVDGRPIAGYAADAKELFDKSELDALVVGDSIIEK
jgi:carbamoyltransferase